MNSWLLQKFWLAKQDMHILRQCCSWIAYFFNNYFFSFSRKTLFQICYTSYFASFRTTQDFWPEVIYSFQDSFKHVCNNCQFLYPAAMVQPYYWWAWAIFDLKYANKNMFTASNKNTRTLCEINKVSERHKLYMMKKYLTKLTNKKIFHSAFTCSNSTMETPEQCVQSVQN